MSSFQIPSDREPWLDPGTQNISRPWFLFLQYVFQRIGGATSAFTDDISAALAEDSGVEELKSVFYSEIQAIQLRPIEQLVQQIEVLESQLNTQRDLLAELTKEVQGIRCGTIS